MNIYSLTHRQQIKEKGKKSKKGVKKKDETR